MKKTTIEEVNNRRLNIIQTEIIKDESEGNPLKMMMCRNLQEKRVYFDNAGRMIENKIEISERFGSPIN